MFTTKKIYLHMSKELAFRHTKKVKYVGLEIKLMRARPVSGITYIKLITKRLERQII